MAKHYAPTHLQRRPQSPFFYFRFRLPEALQIRLAYKEIKYSLRTADEDDALYLALRLGRRLKKLFRNRIIMNSLTKEDIDRLMKAHLQKMLDEAEDERVTRRGPVCRESLRYEQEEQVERLNDNHADFRQALAENDYDIIKGSVDELLSDNNISGVEPRSDTYKRLCRELLKTSIRYNEIESKRTFGDYSDPIPELPKAANLHPETTSTRPHETQGERLSVITEKYAEEQRRTGAWTEKTDIEVISSLRLLEEILSDLPITSIDAGAFRQFKETLLKLPPNMRKDRRYRKLTVDEMVSMDIANHISPVTINKHIGRASALFEWAVNNSYMSRNPASKMQVRRHKKASEERGTFTADDLAKLFRNQAFLEDSHVRSWYFWIPIIGLYTGMRLNEIAQLHLEDIYKGSDGAYVIDVNDKPPRHLKNTASRRLVPLHDFLVNDLRLIDYVERLKGEGGTRLFPELTKRRDGYGHDVTRWFTRFRKACGIPDGEKKVFHSFRHTFINTLTQLGIDDKWIGAVVGHGDDSQTTGRYFKGHAPEFLKENVVDKLRYDVDLSHLKKSRLVTG